VVQPMPVVGLANSLELHLDSQPDAGTRSLLDVE
jgi:hypothetical protein